MGAFHAYDIRGIYNVDFDKETVYKIGYFIPQLLPIKYWWDAIAEYLQKKYTNTFLKE